MDRTFDEVGDIVQEERQDPVRLWCDPHTCEEGPAPWLWYWPD